MSGQRARRFPYGLLTRAGERTAKNVITDKYRRIRESQHANGVPFHTTNKTPTQPPFPLHSPSRGNLGRNGRRAAWAARPPRAARRAAVPVAGERGRTPQQRDNHIAQSTGRCESNRNKFQSCRFWLHIKLKITRW